MEYDLEKWGHKGSVIVKGVEVETYKAAFTSCNTLEVEVGTTGPMGGDTGHGGRTFLRLNNASCTDMTCREHHDNYGHSWVEIELGGDTELDTFYDALQFAVAVLGQHTNGVEEYEPEISKLEQRQTNFAMYLNEVCSHFRKEGKLRGFSEIQEKYHVTPISQQLFFECELHKAGGYVSQEFCNQVYEYILLSSEERRRTPAPKYVNEETNQ